MGRPSVDEQIKEVRRAIVELARVSCDRGFQGARGEQLEELAAEVERANFVVSRMRNALEKATEKAEAAAGRAAERKARAAAIESLIRESGEGGEAA